MASNKKWFKRAIRALRSGESRLWEIIKENLSPEQVAHIESEFLPKSATDTGPPKLDKSFPSSVADSAEVIAPDKINVTQNTEDKTATKKDRQPTNTPTQKAVKKRTVVKGK